MRHFKGYIKTDKVGSRCEFEFEVEDDASEEEIDEVARDVAFDRIEWFYEEARQS